MSLAGQLRQGLLERDEEIAFAASLCEGVRDGSGAVLYIEGPAGIGKSTLLHEITFLGRELGLRALPATCAELEQAFPFGVARQLFEPLVGQAGHQEREALLAGPASLTGTLFGAAADQAPDIDAMAHGLFWLAANLGEAEPLLLVVDDAHWCDLATLRALAYLARRIAGLPALLVVAARRATPGDPAEQMLTCLADVAARTIEPTPLSEVGTASLVRDALGAGPQPGFIAACHAATGGNPFYLRELLRSLAAEGVAPLDAAADRVKRVHPRTIARAIMGRLGALSPEAGALARAVAALGEGAPVHRAATLAGIDPATATGCADELAGAQILRPELPLVFAHPIVRAVVADSMPLTMRVALHAAAARALHREGRPALELAPHLLLCEPSGDQWLVERLAAASEEALARGAIKSAARYLERTLREPPVPDARTDLELRLARVETRIPRPEAIDRFRGAMATLPPGDARARIARELGVALGLAGRAAEGLEVVDTALAELAGDHAELTPVLAVTALDICRLDMRLRPEVEERLDRVRRLSREHSELDWVVDANLALESSVVGEPAATGVALARRALANEPPGRVRPDYEVAPYAALMVLWRADVLDEPAMHYERLLAEAQARGDLHSAALLMWYQASVGLRAGDLATAETNSRQAQELLSGWEFIYFTVMGPLVEALIERGELDEAAAVVAGSGLPDDAPRAKSHLEACEARARLRIALGDVEGGLAEYLAIGRLRLDEGRPNPAWSAWRSGAALAHHALGNEAEARRLADDELELARRFGAPRTLGVALRAAATVRGGDVELLREAVDVLERSPCRLDHAHALVDLGAAVLRTGARMEAREPLSKALDLATRCDAVRIAERARAELVASGARPRRAALTGIEALTPSERRVAELATEGLTNRQIAEALYVTIKTVETHLRNVYDKLGVGGKSELPRALAARR